MLRQIAWCAGDNVNNVDPLSIRGLLKIRPERDAKENGDLVVAVFIPKPVLFPPLQKGGRVDSLFDQFTAPLNS
ncbi:hypothetical protein IEQ11_17250 [Lysobacter capsici]|uniref:hypothetical protein n=1 Tax=Lysobacter capsici TaxID=435897 RepID=UPI0017841AEE|nr:hypothetical protein [Lysobacter capsici]UOF13482.1 hypothetical protein IEQ11_17250 [Lysobacter capsici]